MSLFGPVTNADRRRWQIRDAAALLDLLQAAHKADLPPISWQLTSGGLLGRCPGLATEAAAQREQFEAWVAFLGDGVTRWPEQSHDGTTRLRAGCRGYGPRRVDVAIVADIFDDEPVGGAQ